MKKLDAIRVLEIQIEEDEILMFNIDYEITELEKRKEIIVNRINSLLRKKDLLYDEKKDLIKAKKILKGE